METLRMPTPLQSFSDMMRAEMMRSSFAGLGSPFGGLDGPSDEVKPKEEAPAPPVSWDDIIGLEDAKEALKDAIEQPFLNADIYKFFNLKPPKGVLLYGPPGCGKTMLGKACAASMAKVHGKPYKEGFFYFNGAEMIGPGFSSEVDWMKKGFQQAKEFKQKHGYPAILFYDECDSMLPKRRQTNFFVKNAVNIFLSKMDGMEEPDAFVILATNNHHELDEAATRAGRIDRKIYVGRPEAPAVSAMVASYLKKKPLMEGVALEALVEAAVVELFRESRTVGAKPMHTKLNGGIVAGIVENAASIAFKAAIRWKAEHKTMDGFSMGVNMDALLAAIDVAHKELSMMKEKTPKGRNPWENLSRDIPVSQDDDTSNGVK